MCDAWLVNGEYDPLTLDGGAGSVYVDLSCGGAWKVERSTVSGQGGWWLVVLALDAWISDQGWVVLMVGSGARMACGGWNWLGPMISD